MIYVNELPPNLQRLHEKKETEMKVDDSFNAQLMEFLSENTHNNDTEIIKSQNPDIAPIEEEILKTIDTASREQSYIIVKDGDTLSEITQNILKTNNISYNYSVIQSFYNQIAAYNDLQDPNKIPAGLRLEIPSQFSGHGTIHNTQVHFAELNNSQYPADFIRNMFKEKISIDKILPEHSRISSKFGPRTDPITRTSKFHNGIDIAAKTGTPIMAPSGGKVIEAGYDRGYGNYIKILCKKGLEWRFAHLQKLRVKSGSIISKGDTIGNVGSTGRSTGPHLHLEVRKNGVPFDPLFLISS